jgi:hypothetical protein
MVKVARNDHSVKEIKSFPAWNKDLKVKRRIDKKDKDGHFVRDANGVIETVMRKAPVLAEKKSQMNHLHMSSKVQRHWGALWSTADKCHLWRQKIKPVKNADGTTQPLRKGPSGKTITERSNRVLSGHTLKTLSSGAVASVNAQLHADAKLLRLDTTWAEDSKYPMLPTYSVGAAYAIESAFVAYVQEIFSVALDIQKAHKKKHSKVTAKCCQAAADIVNKKLSSSTGFVPESMGYRKPIKVKKESMAAAPAGK